MGDLHCASLHLKSQTHASRYQEYAAQNPSFEVDWMSDRQRAYEQKLEANTTTEAFVAPVITVPPLTIPTINASISDGIPLQIPSKSSHSGSVVASIPPTPTPSVPEIQGDEKKSRKKKRKQEDRKEKRKKKRSKKRKHQSSSSSSSSDTTDSEPETKAISPTQKVKGEASHSIRVAMRNLLKQQNEEKLQMEESAGKWTVVQAGPVTLVPPPPTISANGAEDKIKDEQMIAEWNEPGPSIDEKEKKLLEQIRGKVKGRRSSEREASEARAAQLRREDSREDRRRVSRDRSRNRSIERGRDRMDRGRGRRSRSRGRRSRSRSRGRRSRSRSRSRSGGRYGRRRSRSRSRSRRVEKPIVRYPEFRPRVPEAEVPKKKSRNDDEQNGKSEKRKANALKKANAAAAAANNAKKLPFIGRMPVFKKQTTGKA